MISTLKAISGDGYPGVASWDILGNVIPFIDGEEYKIETESKKFPAGYGKRRAEPHPVTVSASTTRVAVQNGHTESISVALEHPPGPDALIDAFNAFKGKPQQLDLPSAPPQPVVYLTERNRPQP